MDNPPPTLRNSLLDNTLVGVPPAPAPMQGESSHLQFLEEICHAGNPGAYAMTTTQGMVPNHQSWPPRRRSENEISGNRDQVVVNENHLVQAIIVEDRDLNERANPDVPIAIAAPTSQKTRTFKWDACATHLIQQVKFAFG